MSEPFDTYQEPAGVGNPTDPQVAKKKKLWRNLFIFNLCVTLLLIGLFWLPLKFVQINEFLDSSSVNMPKQKNQVRGNPMIAEAPPVNPDLLPTRGVVINATSEEKWAYFDFSRGEQVEIFDPSSLEWDIAFRRGKAITNGGASNKIGKAGVIDLGEVDFDSVDQVPSGKFVMDTATRTQTENPALAQWYKYNYITHKLTARKNVYAFRTADAKYVKVQFSGFYCADKEPGCVQVRYVYQDDGSKSFLKKENSLVSTASTTTAPASAAKDL